MLEIKHLYTLLRLPQASQLRFEQLIAFVLHAARLKNDIILVQPASYNPADITSSPLLPPVIQTFLSEATSIPLEIIKDVWSILGPTALHGQLGDLFDDRLQAQLYETSGHAKGITHRTIYPSAVYCENISCDRSGRLALKKTESRQCVLFTMKGAVPVWSVHLYCERCNINYHHNFQVYQDERIYYEGVPETLQIGEHQFAEKKVINMWISMMQHSWTSASNCARIYNTAFTAPKRPEWQFSLDVTPSEVYDAFTIISLLEDCEIRHERLTVRHDGTLRERFQPAVRARNERFRLYSQPELFHYCGKCTRFLETDGSRLKVSVVVIDGVTVGHPCCGVPNCKTSLANNHARFCPEHKAMDDVCAVVGCAVAVLAGKRTCANLEHQAVEEFHNTRGQARFQLKGRLEASRLAHPNDAVGQEVESVTDLLTDDDHEEEFEVSQVAALVPTPLAPTVADKNLKVRAKFGRTRTHNEQLFVLPCGVIVARETFYHAEAIYSVVEMIKRTYRIPGTMPEHIFFDNNCQIARIVANDPVFKHVGLTVDVFHFKCKHSKNDTFCQKNCDPADFPELLGEGKKQWFFNSSIAEQTNAWLGGYHAICREMHVDRFNFFLDEMIRRRNYMTLAKLEEDGLRPSRWPREMSG